MAIDELDLMEASVEVEISDEAIHYAALYLQDMGWGLLDCYCGSDAGQGCECVRCNVDELRQAVSLAIKREAVAVVTEGAVVVPGSRTIN